jgi:hypothetical protein
VCGRTVRLVNSGEPESCWRMVDLRPGMNGRGYAVITDGGSNRIGTCSVELSLHHGKNCDPFAAWGFESKVYCAFW